MTGPAMPRRWYDMARAATTTPGATTDEATIRIYGDIGDPFWFFDDGGTTGANDFVEDLDELGEVNTIHIRLNSPGGDFADGITIMNALKEHAATVVVHVDGIAASAASLIAMAGDKIIMGRGAQMMVHDASMGCYGTAADLKQMAQACDSISASMASIYAERAGGTASAWRTAMANESWYGPDESVAAGLADTTSVEDNPPPTPPDEGEDEEVEGEEQLEGDEDELVPRRMAATMRSSRIAARFRYKGRAQAPAPLMPAGRRPVGQDERSRPVAFSDDQLADMRQSLGLPADADEGTILAGLHEALSEQAEEGAPAASATRPPAALPPGTRLVDEGAWQTMQADATAGRKALDAQINARRDGTVQAAVRDGKIPPARAKHWRTLLEEDEEGTTQTLASLEKGLLPVTAKGYDGGGPSTEDDEGSTAPTLQAALEDPIQAQWHIAGAPGFAPFAVRGEGR